MNEIQVFTNGHFGDVRVSTKNGEPLFCGKDVAEALGYKRTADAIATHCKGVCELPTPTSGGMQKMKYIPEGDLYRLVVHSQLPDAERFESWIFDEVLPTIRKTGGYVANDDLFIQTYLPNADESTKIMFKAQLNVIQDLNHKIALNAPKVAFAEKVSASDASLTVAQMATLLKQNGVQTGQNRFYAWLRDHGYCVAVGARRNAPTQKSLELGVLEAQEVALKVGDKDVLKLSSRVTPKGQGYFLKKLTEQTQVS